jgi:type II secretory ATPase GspE/PulE/Tfp pilus assembly ATPase PilB-like protein
MNCDLARTEMIAYLQGELPAEQKTALELHLAGCPDCRAQLEQSRRLLEWTAAASDEAVISMVDEIILDAFQTGASDIHLDPQSDNSLRVRYRVDGVLQDVRRLDPLLREGIVARLKMMCEMNVTETRLAQDGLAFVRSRDDRTLEIIILTNPFLWGEGVVIRFLDTGRTLPGMGALGLSDSSRDAIEHLLHQPSGLLIVTGPTGSPLPPSGVGNATTLYAMLQEINNPGIKIVTIEKPAVYRVEGICQSMVNGTIGYTLPRALRSVMRMDPDVILVGEVPNAETAQLCLQLALTGHLIIASLDTTHEALFAIQHLRNMGQDDVILGSSLIGVVAQRLVRKVCPVCKQEFTPGPNDPYLRALGITDADAAGHTLVRGAGCDACRRTGYRDRTSLFEVLTLNKEMAALIGSGADMAAIADAARAAGHRSLRDDGRQKVLDGVTTPEEVIRVLA